LHFCHDTDNRRVALSIATNVAAGVPFAIDLREIETVFARANRALDIREFRGQGLSQCGIVREQVHHETQSRFFPHPGKPSK
jgi:hypothetical protein